MSRRPSSVDGVMQTRKRPGQPLAVRRFAQRVGYNPRIDDRALTLRAVLIGSFFALINAVVNMLFAFRYAGGLAQYYVILLAYPFGRLTERLPAGSRLNPGPFNAKEHCIVMTIALAGSLAGTLGLSGGMLSLNLYFDTRLPAYMIYAWSAVAGFFGLFFGNCFFTTLVLPDRYEWPFSLVNASFIAAFHAGDGQKKKGGAGRDVSRGRSSSGATTTAKNDSVGASLRVFGMFFTVSFVWFIVPNYFAPLLFTMSVLCWAPHEWRPVQPFGRGGLKDLTSVLGSGEAGAGVPGLGGWLSVWAYGPSVISLPQTIWIVVGCVLVYWIFIPWSFFSGE